MLEVNVKIAKNVSKFLKKRMEYTRRLIKDNGEIEIKFSEFISAIKDLENDNKKTR